MPTLEQIQELEPEERQRFEDYVKQSFRRVQKRNGRISAAERQLETDPDYERKQDESEH